jgi:hypothetical protein
MRVKTEGARVSMGRADCYIRPIHTEGGETRALLSGPPRAQEMRSHLGPPMAKTPLKFIEPRGWRFGPS